MRVDLSEIIERGEGAFLVFPMRTRVYYTWHVAGRAHLRRREQGYLVPVGDSIVREQLKNIHVGCEVTPETGGMSEVDADELDNVLRLAGMPFMVERGPALRESTENAVWVRFPGEDEIPIQFSRYRKWQAFWGKRAVLLWWQCESEAEWQRRIEDEWRASGGRMTLPQTTAFLPDGEDDADDDEPLGVSNHHAGS